MHELYELKDKLCEELKNYAKKDVTASSLTMVDTLAHALKNIDKVIEKYEEEEEEYSSRRSYDGGSMRGSYGGSMMAGSYGMRSNRGNSRGSYARRRDSMGRYSREGSSGDEDMIMELQDLMRNAPDERTRMKIQSIMQKMDA